MKTDPIKRAKELRKTLVGEKGTKLLVVDFKDTLQGKDTSKIIDLMQISGSNNFPFRTKVNVKGIDPIATKGESFFDVREKTEEEIEEFIKRQEFDFPLWFKHDSGFSMKEAHKYNLPFILQVAGCNFHDGTSIGGCWYCFVDNKSNDGKPGNGKVGLRLHETINSIIDSREKIIRRYKDEHGFDMDLRVLRTSGGEPTIALDWILNLWRMIGMRGLDFVGQIDTNLSTGRMIDEFEKKGIFEKFTLEKLAEHPVKVLTAIKGTDDENLKRNVQSHATLENQIYSLKRFVKAGFDIYPQMYNPNPESLYEYLTLMDRIIPCFSMRVHIGPLSIYSPTTQRLTQRAQMSGMNKDKIIPLQKNSWNRNYERACEIIDLYLRNTYGVEYKQVTRSDVDLKLKE